MTVSCHTCGAAPEPDERMIAAGMPIGRMGIPLDEHLPDDTAPLGRCRRCPLTSRLTPGGLCAPCKLERLFEVAEAMLHRGGNGGGNDDPSEERRMTDLHKAYWYRLEQAARAAAAAFGDEDPDPLALIDRILDAAASPPAGITNHAAGKRAIEVATAELRRLTEAQQAEADTIEKLARHAAAHGIPAGVPVIPWLTKRGLVRRVGGRLQIVPLGPRPVA